MAEERHPEEYHSLPEHTSHNEYTPLNPDISFFKESSVSTKEENIFQGTVPPGEEENPFTAARRKKKDKKRYAMLSRFLAGAVRAGAAAFCLLLIGLIVLLNKDSADSDTALQAKEILETAQRPLQVVHDDYGPEEIGGVWVGNPASPHKYDLEHPIIAKEAGCTEEGEIRFVCTECGVVLSEKLAAHGHSPAEKVTENEVASSCMERGRAEEVIYCSVCEEELSRETTVIAATGHTEGDAVEENKVDATCTKDGSCDTVIYCETCGEELSRETVVLEATGHNYSARVTAAACTARGYTTHTCSRCGSSYTDSYTAALGHSFNNCTSSTCTRCGTRALTLSFNSSINVFNYTIQSDFLSEARRLSIYIAGAVVVDMATNSNFNSIEIDASTPSGQIYPAMYAPVSGHRYEMRLSCGTSTVIYSNRVTVN